MKKTILFLTLFTLVSCNYNEPDCQRYCDYCNTYGHRTEDCPYEEEEEEKIDYSDFNHHQHSDGVRLENGRLVIIKEGKRYDPNGNEVN